MNLRDAESGLPLMAHVPNTGRMTEFLIPDREFALLPTPQNKIKFRVVATRYQGQWVFLDTIRCNHIAQELLNQGKIPEIMNIRSIQREVTWEDSRFDFLITHHSGQKTWLEVKSVTLCHNGIALFPDAPTERGLKHIETQARLRDQQPNTRVMTLYLILNGSAKRFSFNVHTHEAYAQAAVRNGGGNILAYRLPFDDPITFTPQDLSPVPIDFITPNELSGDRGAYLLLLYLSTAVRIDIGALGSIHFSPGYYLYAGSAMNSLSKRIRRHLGIKKKEHWHLDYLRPHATWLKAFPIRSSDRRLEGSLVEALMKTDLVPIQGFGSSDSPHPSHLFYSPSNPLRRADITKILFDAYTRAFAV